jgi:AcrR family transcriptional regulator
VARRGQQLREHILWCAKDAFLESGFERTSMDVVAARAETSKRSLYAHFPSKDALFSGVVELVRGLYLDRLGSPEDHDDGPVEAVVRYCARLRQLLLWVSSLRTVRMGIAEAERLPEAAAGYHQVIVEVPTTRLAGYLAPRWGLDDDAAHAAAEALVARTLHPALTETLLGVRAPLPEPPDDARLADDVDLDALRAVARQVLGDPAETDQPAVTGSR